MTDGASAEIAAALRESRKYGCLCEDTLRRVARWAASRHARTKDAVKAAKRKLHQACGAYLGGFDPAEAGAVARGLPNDPPRDVLRDACLGVLGRHVSTAERAPFMEEAYAEMFRRTGTPRVLVDVACGLNPFAFPWMGSRITPSTSTAESSRRRTPSSRGSAWSIPPRARTSSSPCRTSRRTWRSS